MYEQYWQIDRKPFDGGADERFYYPGESHQGALLKLRYAIESRQAGALLAGASGLGKTLLVQTLFRQLPAQFGPLVHLVFPKMPPDELLAYLATELGATSGHEPVQTIQANVRAIERLLLDNARAGKHAVVVIDEAQLLDEAASLEVVRLLLNFEVDGQPAMTLLLVGQPNLLPVLDRHPALEERLGVKCLLRPLNLEETVSYVHHRLGAAGARRAIFDNDALTTLFHLSHGAPRQINRLCDLALLVGYADEQPSITVAQLEAVSDELVTVSPE